MKKVLINIIKIYQKMPLRAHSKCKYIPTCSNYAIEALTVYSIPKGIFLTIKRILRCNPFSKGGYDPIPKKENL